MAFEHVNVYVTVDDGFTDCDPDVALLPDQPPLAVHELAFVEDQVSVLDSPTVSCAGFAVSVTVGTTGAVMVNVIESELHPVSQVCCPTGLH